MKKHFIILIISLASELAANYNYGLAVENMWVSNGPPGGSVISIMFNPLNSQIIYVGTVQNGLYKSIDGGANWIHLPLGGLNPTIRTIQIHPFGPDTMFVGTAHGIFKSEDGGNSWVLVQLPDITYGEFQALLIHPQFPNIIFCGFIGGFKSTDGGESWQPLELPTFQDFVDFEIDPLDPNIIYFSSGNFPAGHGIWKSTNMGENWVTIQNNIDSTGFSRDLAIDPVTPNILYLARSQSSHEGDKFLSKSLNGGLSWDDITPANLTEPIILKVLISPVNHNEIWIATSKDGVLKSVDGGHSWLKKNQGLKMLQVPSIEINVENNYLIIGTFDDGLYKSTNNGENWNKISQSFAISNCTDIAINDVDSVSIFASSYNGLFKSGDLGENWNYLEMGTSVAIPLSRIKINPNNHYTIYACSFSTADTMLPGFWRSRDNGMNWLYLNNGLPNNNSFTDMDISAYALNDQSIILTSNNGVFFSTDDGDHWSLYSNGLPPINGYSAIAVSPSDPALMALGDYYNRVFITTNRGISWYRTHDPPLNLDGFICYLNFNPETGRNIYISSLFSGCWMSSDLGQSWSSLLGDLPIDPQRPQYPVTGGIAINPFNSNNIFVSSTHMGIFQTHDGGIHWESFNNGLDTAGVFGNRLYFFPNDTTYLIIPSALRSVWSIHRTIDGVDEDMPSLPGTFSLSSYPNPFNAQTMIRYSLPKNEPVTLTVYNLLGQKVATLFDGTQTAGEHSLVWDASHNSSGLYLARLEAGEKVMTSKLLLLR